MVGIGPEYENYDPSDNEGKRCSEHGILLTDGCHLCDPWDYTEVDGVMYQNLILDELDIIRDIEREK